MNAIPAAAAFVPPVTGADLSRRAMLATLSIKQWSATRTDKKVSREVAEKHNAAADAGRYNKRLVAKAALAKIAEIATDARGAHYSATLPWSDAGPRILSARGFADYSAKLRTLRDQFESAVADFVAGYPQFVEDAKATLNGMFNPADYPDASGIAGRFAFKIEFQNMPAAADFRVELDAAQVSAIRDAMETTARDAFAAATRDVWQRIAESVGHMAGKLRAYKPGGEGATASGIFRDSLVENVRSLAALLPSLNIGEDPELARIAARIDSDLCRDDAKELRDNASARDSVAAAAESILADVSAYLA